MSKQIKDTQEKQPVRILNIQDSDEDEDKQLQEQIQTFVKFQLRRLKFASLESEEKQKILDLFSKQMHGFVNQTYVIHDSEISTVLLGLKKNLKFSKKLFNGQLIILKATKIVTKSYEQVLEFESIKFVKKQNQNKSILITMQEFKGISLDKIVSYFARNNFIRLDVVENLTKQLIKKVRDLHQKNIIHGDINVGNIVVRSKEMLQKSRNQSKQKQKQKDQLLKEVQREFQNQVQLLYQAELQTIIKGLFNCQYYQENIQQKQKSTTIELQLIDYSHSWIEKQKQPMTKNDHNQTSHQSPTQTINYRSPQSLYTRGSFQIDVWSIGHVIFTLLTGESIFNMEIQWTPQQLQQIFSNSQAFYMHIKQELKIKQQMLRKSELKVFQQLQNIIMSCLKIDKCQRPSIFELCQQLKVDL